MHIGRAMYGTSERTNVVETAESTFCAQTPFPCLRSSPPLPYLLVVDFQVTCSHQELYAGTLLDGSKNVVKRLRDDAT